MSWRNIGDCSSQYIQWFKFFLFNQLAVVQPQSAAGNLCGLRVVRDHQQGSAQLLVELLQQFLYPDVLVNRVGRERYIRNLSDCACAADQQQIVG